jgi:hypothetical protein
MEVLEKNKVFSFKQKNNVSFVIKNDIELLEKLRESENDFNNN